MVIGYTTGVFDMFHIGHLNILKRAKKYCDYLIVGVSTDECVESYKHHKPVIPYEERAAIVAAVKYVDEVITYKDVDDIIKKVDFDVFAKGPDQNHAGFQRAVEWAKEKGKEAVVVPRTDGISSTTLRNYLKEND